MFGITMKTWLHTFLRWSLPVGLSEPHLLSCIADTYRLIAFLNDREKHAQTVAYGINVTFPDGENAGQRLLRENRGFYQPLMNQINKAIIAISNELSSKSSEER